MSIHQYTIASFSGKRIFADHLHKLIAEDAIVFPGTWGVSMNLPDCVDKVKADFTSSLTGAQITALDSIMSGYAVPTALQTMPKAVDHFQGYQLSWAAIDTIDIGAGMCSDLDGDSDIILDSTITLDKDVSGVGGIDTGTLTASTSYSIFAISDLAWQEPVGCLFSLSPTAPTMPSGYNRKRRIGSFSVDSSSEIMDFHCWIENGMRRYQWEENRNPSLRCLDAGVSTSWADIDLDHTVSDVATTVLLTAQTSSALGYLRRDGSDIAAGENLVNSGGFASFNVGILNNKVEYKVSSGSMTADIIGFREPVGL